VPFRHSLELWSRRPGVDFSAGPGPQTISLPGLPPASPLICYEAIFPGEVADAAARPSWLLNISNDAWFGISAVRTSILPRRAFARWKKACHWWFDQRRHHGGHRPLRRIIAQLALGAPASSTLCCPALAPTLYARAVTSCRSVGVMMLLASFW